MYNITNAYTQTHTCTNTFTLYNIHLNLILIMQIRGFRLTLT